MGAVALSTAEYPAGKTSPAQLNKTKGTTSVKMPSPVSDRQCARSGQAWRVQRMMALSTSAARAQRRQAMATGPKAGAATRMSGNEPPQTADKRTSWVN